MTDSNYKEYSLKNLETWLYDAMSCGDATPQEIYDVIVSVVKDEYYTYKKRTSEAYELLALLNSGVDNNKYQDYLNKTLSCDKDDPSPECKDAWNDFWNKEDQVTRWVLPVELDGLSGECYVTLPDDLLEKIGIKEGDMVHWIDQGDGSFKLKKV